MQLMAISAAFFIVGALLEAATYFWMGKYSKFQLISLIGTTPFAVVTALVITWAYLSLSLWLALIVDLVAISLGCGIILVVVSWSLPQKIEEADHRGTM